MFGHNCFEVTGFSACRIESGIKNIATNGEPTN